MVISTPLISIPVDPGIVFSPIPFLILWFKENFFKIFWGFIIFDLWENKVNVWVSNTSVFDLNSTAFVSEIKNEEDV